MNLRRLALTLAFSAAAFSASAAEKAVSVVKILNFSCPVCRASETQDAAIKEATQATGGRLVYAPMPTEEGTYARERVYYASRSQGSIAESRVRAALYRGSQDLSLPLSDITQVIEFLKDELGASSLNYTLLRQEAESPAAQEALARAATVTVTAGSRDLPSYVLIQDNAPVATLETTNLSKGTSLLSLRDEVVARVNQLSAGKK